MSAGMQAHALAHYSDMARQAQVESLTQIPGALLLALAQCMKRCTAADLHAMCELLFAAVDDRAGINDGPLMDASAALARACDSLQTAAEVAA